MFDLGTFKELLSPHKFSLFSYALVIVFSVVEVTFIALGASLRSTELDKFQCKFRDDKDYLTKQCYAKYDMQYNSPLTLHGFVAWNFASMVVVCLVYSCCVHSRIRKVVEELSPSEQPPRSRQIFWCYFLHVIARLVVMTVFTVFLATLVFLRGIPSEFSCVLPTEQPQIITNSNITNTELKPTSHAINCVSPVARKKTVTAKFIGTGNLIFLFLMLCETIYLAVRALGSSDFTFDSRFCVEYLNTTGKYATSLIRQHMQQRILHQTNTVDRLITRGFEGDKLFDDMFVHPLILIGRANYEGFTRLTENNLTATHHEEGSLMNNYEELFPTNVNDANSRKILIVGRPGTGKSFLCKKLLRDWSNNACYIANRFDYAFLLKFWWFNSVATELISLRELIHRAEYLVSTITDVVFKQLFDNPGKVLIMFDGLDEFNDRETTEEAYANTARERMPFFALYLKLMRGKLLLGATILTTSRAIVAQSCSLSQPDKTAELVGFTKEEVLKYIANYCKQDENITVARKIKEHINTNDKLLSLCSIPDICRIVCFLLREELINAASPETVTLAENITSVYERVLKFFIFSHHPECKSKPFQGIERFPQTVEQDLTDLESLAKRGVAEGRTVFSSEEVTTRLRNCGLLIKMLDLRVTAYQWEEQFCFIYPTLQELLAAREIVKMDPDTISAFIAATAKDPMGHLVIQFVAGLLSGQQREAVNSLVNCLHDSFLSDPTNGKMALLMMKFFYYYNDEATVKGAASELEGKLKENCRYPKCFDMRDCQVTPVDCTAVVYFLKHINSLPYSLDLANNSVSEDGCKTIAELIKTKSPLSLDLSNNEITDQGLQRLIGATGRKTSNLKELHLGFHRSICEEALLDLCGMLTTRNCKLSSLDLNGSHVTDNVFNSLCETLEDANCKLTDLLLGGGKITDEGVRRLCESLKHENCKLTRLSIDSEEMTDRSLLHFSEAL